MMLDNIEEAQIVPMDESEATVPTVEEQKAQLKENGVEIKGTTVDKNTGKEVVLVDPNSPNISSVGAGAPQDTAPIPPRIQMLMRYEKIPRYAMTEEQKRTLAQWRNQQSDRIAVSQTKIASATPFTIGEAPVAPPVKDTATITATKKTRKRKSTRKKTK